MFLKHPRFYAFVFVKIKMGPVAIKLLIFIGSHLLFSMEYNGELFSSQDTPCLQTCDWCYRGSVQPQGCVCISGTAIRTWTFMKEASSATTDSKNIQ